MNPITKLVQAMGPGSYVVQAVIASLIGAALLLAFIMGRRAARRRYFGRRDARAQMLRRQLPEILAGRIMPEAWRRDPLDDRILEAILLDCLEVAEREEAEQIRHCLRISGLLDKRIHQARHRRGWRRLNTLVALGRMRCPEAIPALAEGLDDENEQVAVAAARGLGRYAMPEAAEPILERLEHGRLRRLPANVLQSALYHCCRERPSLLLHALHFADDQLRPLLARVLAEVASAELGEDLVQLASDPLPEVRASAARAMAGARPRLALAGLQQLAADSEWFVRLRAVVALGMLQDARAIPVLLETLCDRNRFVRLRAAGALSRLEGHEEILVRAIRTRDRYALQALIGEMQRSGAMLAVLNGLADPRRRQRSQRILLAAVRAGAPRLLLDAVLHHANWRVRTQAVRLLADSQDPEVLRLLRFHETNTQRPRERILLAWLERRLRETVESAEHLAPAAGAAALPRAAESSSRAAASLVREKP